MPPDMSTNGPGPANDDLDDLFDYNVNMDDVFRDANVSMNVEDKAQDAQPKSKDKGLGLGIDEEIKVTKKRQPVPKLDDNRSCPLQRAFNWRNELI